MVDALTQRMHYTSAEQAESRYFASVVPRSPSAQPMPGRELTSWHPIFPAKSRVPRHNGVVIICSHCCPGWISAEEIGRVLNPHQPLTAASARREMNRAGISEERGYPADEVRAYAASRPGKGRWVPK